MAKKSNGANKVNGTTPENTKAELSNSTSHTPVVTDTSLVHDNTTNTAHVQLDIETLFTRANDQDTLGRKLQHLAGQTFAAITLALWRDWTAANDKPNDGIHIAYNGYRGSIFSQTRKDMFKAHWLEKLGLGGYPKKNECDGDADYRDKINEYQMHTARFDDAITLATAICETNSHVRNFETVRYTPDEALAFFDSDTGMWSVPRWALLNNSFNMESGDRPMDGKPDDRIPLDNEPHTYFVNKEIVRIRANRAVLINACVAVGAMRRKVPEKSEVNNDNGDAQADASANANVNGETATNEQGNANPPTTPATPETMEPDAVDTATTPEEPTKETTTEGTKTVNTQTVADRTTTTTVAGSTSNAPNAGTRGDEHIDHGKDLIGDMMHLSSIIEEGWKGQAEPMPLSSFKPEVINAMTNVYVYIVECMNAEAVKNPAALGDANVSRTIAKHLAEYRDKVMAKAKPSRRKAA